jgi:phosphoribosyl 1,2-cyclic phosphate phosphodiesterase
VTYRRRFTILGCSSSPGVPRITGDWGACDPKNVKNRRTRAAFLVEQIAPDGGITTVVIDTGPDFREQMIHAGVSSVDAVLYTHAHADHIHGIDDLRGFFHNSHERIPIYADPPTMDRIREGFRYCLETPPGSSYPPIVRPVLIESLDKAVRSASGRTSSCMAIFTRSAFASATLLIAAISVISRQNPLKEFKISTS